ncbi:MAG: hypothetical protein ACRDYZ_00065 [Acidimicrobiales bacterium]
MDVPSLDAAATRVDSLLEELRTTLGEREWEQVVELVRCLTDLYGGGLARVVAGADPDLVARLARDELVGSLLVLHGLHPEPFEERVRAGLTAAGAALRPFGARLRLVRIDAEELEVRVRVEGPAGSRPATRDRWAETVRREVGDPAPEATVDISVNVAAPVSPEPAPPGPPPSSPVAIGRTRAGAGGAR